VAEADLSDARYSDNFRKLMAFQVERAQATYRQAFAQLPATDRKAQRAGLIMSAIYRATLDEIVRDDYRVLHQRISLPPLRKLWLAGKTWWLALTVAAVIGAGYAGMAAAVELCEAGHTVDVFEASRTLGGRARAAQSTASTSITASTS
jgi:hypothetical protein